MIKDISASIEACAAHYGENADAMRQYLIEGQAKAVALPNRGPLTFDKHGQLDKGIVDAYQTYGFYIFENVLDENELADIEQDLAQLKQRFASENGAKTNAKGEPALGVDCKAPNLLWAKSLGDPLGGTPIANGRHQVKLFEPTAASSAPKESPFVLLGSLQFSPACLRVYAQPELLKVAEAINGKDFAPFHECLFIKEPGLGAAVSWHQDGDTHWDAPEFDAQIHGFNFMAQVYGSTAVNGVWVVPGSHKKGRIDIKKLVQDTGSERIADALPIICNPGDVVICNRQLLHGSFANTGFEPRITINFGFHKRTSVLNVKGAGIHSEAVVFNEALIEKRSHALGYAIEARKAQYPNETPYQYQPLAHSKVDFSWQSNTLDKLKDYNLLDLSI
ncbi:Phytanoyl-CoA dioxygenase [Glaciecola sp. 4H-3-7+YE-5]|nr:Phytanoyl-CoA dioxygenase [Glaciecola sp. 4H-3-7+YE-5]